MKVTVYGASDDLVELEGDLSEEFSTSNDGGFLSFSDGTILLVEYRDEGLWKISQLAVGAADFSLRPATDLDKDYSDRATLEGDFRWALWTEKPENGQRIFVKAKRGSV